MSDFLKTAQILIVDDFSGFRRTLKSMLNHLDAKNIDQACTGFEAIKSCSEKSYNVIFCDYNLGDGQDGQQILEELHQRSLIKRGTLFFMVTAETSTAQVMGAIEFRPDGYLTKPFTGEQLEKRLSRLVEKNLSLEVIYQTINSGELEKAVEVCDLVINISPKVRFSCLRIKSELYVELKNYDSALSIYNDVIKEQPVLWAMMGVGKIYFDNEDFHKAKNYFVDILKSFPQQVNVLDWIAKCEAALGEYDKAELTLIEAVSISPKSLTRQLSLGKVASSLKHDDIAQQAFTQSIQEGNYSCMLKPKHYQYYYDNTRKVAKTLSGMDKAYLMSTTDSIFKKMEARYRTDPAAMATNLSSVAKLYSDEGQADKAAGMLSKLSVALNEGGHNLPKKEAEEICKNLEGIDDESSKKFLGAIANHLDDIKQNTKIADHEDEPLIETLPANSFYAETDQLQTAKKINKEGLQLIEKKEPMLALEKFREAIKISPQNSSYYLNAAHVILFSASLYKIPELIEEARNYLHKSDAPNDSLLRRQRYESLMEKLSNA